MRVRRLLGWFAAGVVAALLLAAAAGVWWIGQTTSFVRWALAQASAATDGALDSGEVSGSLLQGVSVSRLTWRDGGTVVEVTGLALGWRPEWLLGGELRLRALRAARVEVTLGPGDGGAAALVLPERIVLPLKVGVDELEIGEIVVRGEGLDLPPVRGLVATLRHDGKAWRLPRFAARIDGWGVLSAEAQLAAQAPFELVLAARAEPALADYPKLPPLMLDAKGPIEAFAARLRVLAPHGQLSIGEPGPAPAWVVAETTVRPLDPAPVRQLSLWLDGVEPDAIGLPGPRARLTGSLKLEAGEATLLAWRGKLELRNALPGPVDAGLMPFSTLETGLDWRDGRLALDAIDVDGGRLRGSASIDTTRMQTLFGQQLPAIEAKLALRDVDLSQVNRQAWPTRLGGTIALARDAVEFALTDASDRKLALSGAARLDGETVRLASLSLRTPSGSLDAAGSARWQAPWRLDLNGRFDGLAPARLAAIAGFELPRQAALLTGLSGEWAASGELAPELALDSRLRIDRGSFDGQQLRVDWRGRVTSDRLSDVALSASLGDMAARAAGSARWQAPWRLDLSGRFDGLEPARLAAIAGVELPGQAALLQRLSGEWAAAGELAPALALDSRLRIDEGKFDGRPLRVDWRGRVTSDRLSGIALSASLGDLAAKARGDAGRAGDRLRVELRAPSLTVLDPALAGAARIEGDVSVAGFDAAALAGSRVALRVDAERLRYEATAVDRLRASIDGTLDAHRLELMLAGAKFDGETVAGSATARGRLDLPGSDGARAWRWDGVIQNLSVTAPLAVVLAGTMPLTLDAGGVQAGPGALTADGGRVDLERAVVRDGRFDVAGEARSLPVSRWAERFGLISKQAASIDDVRLGGRWALAGSTIDDLDGDLQLRISTTEKIDGDGEVLLRLERGQVAGKVDLKLPSLAVANQAIGPEWAVAGRLRVVADVSGTLRVPKLRGTLEGRDLAFVQRRLGWRLAGGVLDARFDGDRLDVETLRLGSGDGSVTLSGTLQLEAMQGRFRLLADRLAVPLGPGQRIVVSGDTEITSKAAELRWTGKIRADEGLIELRGGEAPSLPGDVVVVDTTAPAAPADGARAAEAGAQLKLGADLVLDLGDKLRVRGSGVDARLAGSITLRGTLPEAPRATGTVRIRDGTYRAYGQKLEITRGRVIFNGPLDNPVLDITAMRKGPAVEAGVSITGNVLSPRIRLVSEPDVPDSQKLSWLVLGVGTDDARTGGQVAALQAAAATLFGSEDGGMVGGVQQALGLDVLTIRSASTSGFDANFGATFPGQVGTGNTASTSASQDVIAIGKRLGSNLLLTYEQGLNGVWSLLRLQYDITRRVSVRAQTGTDTAIDLLYFYSFD